MSYLIQSSMTKDNYLIERVAACVSTFGVSDARVWATNRMWAISGSDGWAAAYAASVGTANYLDPDYTPVAGADEEAITDSMILAAVQDMLESEHPEPVEDYKEES